MADEADAAADYQARLNEQALVDHRRAGAGPPQPGPMMICGKPYCRECGEKLPAERLQAVPTACRCARCQEWLDKSNAVERFRV